MDKNIFWDVGWVYTKRKYSKFHHIYGLNYSKIINKTLNIEVEWTIFVPPESPVEIWKIKVYNDSSNKRKLSFFPFIETCLTGMSTYCARYDSFIFGKFDKNIQGVTIHNHEHSRPINKYNGMMSSSIPPSSFDTSIKSFLGTYNDFHNPTTLQNGKCSNSESRGELLCTALQIKLSVPAKKTKEFFIIAGVIDDAKNEHKKYFNKYIKSQQEAAKKISVYFSRTINDRQKLINSASFISPNKELNHMATNWVKQQVDYCLHFSRGWGKGYRDTLGDAQAALIFSASPEWRKDKSF